MPLVYSQLHELASRQLRLERLTHTLQSTALVHEAYLRLVDQRRVQWQDRDHFFAVASRAWSDSSGALYAKVHQLVGAENPVAINKSLGEIFGRELPL